ncbi:MAG: choice-of-anchor Q domain-containing protein [Anaerolineales bacterium]
MSVLRKERLSRLITSIILGLLLTGVVLYALADQTRLVFANSCEVPDSYPTIQSAIDDSQHCDTINVTSGVYTETLLISRNVAISGAGPEQTIVNGNHAGRPVTVNGAGNGIVVSLSGMRLTNGDASTGTSILTQFGGGIVITGGARLNGDNLQIDHNLASSTSSGYGGGVAANGATVYLTNTKIVSNTANQRQGPEAYGSGYGGGVYVKSSVFHLSNSQVMGNLASQHAGDTLVASGGGMHVGAESQVYLAGNTWQGNVARGKDSQACGISNCSAGINNEGGGAIGVSFDTGAAAITITNDTFLDNLANDVDAGTANSDHGGALSFNTTGDTGRITATLIGVAMKGNIAARKVVGSGDIGRGGAVYARHTSLTVKSATILNNQAAESGEGSGGGIYYEAPFEGDLFDLQNSILAGNIACSTSDCGNGAQVYIDHSTQSDNRANIVFTTIADTGLNLRQGIYYASPFPGDSLYITNTIITSHTVGIDNPDGNVAVYYSLFHGNTVIHSNDITAMGNVPGQPDPLFVDPAGDDYHIQTDSPAVDAGVNAGIAVDIDGEVRPQGSGFDIGADEVAIIPPTDTPTPTFTHTPSPTASPTDSVTTTPTPTGTLTPPLNHRIFLPVVLR